MDLCQKILVYHVQKNINVRFNHYREKKREESILAQLFDQLKLSESFFCTKTKTYLKFVFGRKTIWPHWQKFLHLNQKEPILGI